MGTAYRTVIIVLLLGIFSGSAHAQQQQIERRDGHIYVCTFNVYVLGNIAEKYKTLDDEAEIPERVRNLAKVLASGPFDLIALQEVYAGERGDMVIADLVQALQDETGIESYSYLLSEGIGRGLIPEAIAFIYNTATVDPQTVSEEDEYSSLIRLPGRDLVKTRWVAGHFDFTLIAAHLAWGNESDRDAGFKRTQYILTHPWRYSDDPDIIVLGDFNRFGKDYDSATEMLYDPQKYLAPNVTFFDPELISRKSVKESYIRDRGVPGDNPQLLSTTVAQNTNVYDIIFMTKDVDEEYSGSAESVYGEDFGILHFDEPEGFGYLPGMADLTHNELKVAVSDHRPLWAAFNVTDSSHADEWARGESDSPSIAEARMEHESAEEATPFTIVSKGDATFLLNQLTGETWILTESDGGPVWKSVGVSE